MQETRVATRYARSLVEFAKEKGVLEQVANDMLLFVKAANETPQFSKILKNPTIPHGKKLSILNAIFQGKVNEVSLSIFRIVTKKNRESYLIDIAREFTHQYRVINGTELAEVTTTFPLNEAARNNFRSLIARSGNKSKIELKEKVDKSILGGYILKIGDNQVDQSIKTKLQKVRSKFKDNPYISKL